MEGGEYLSVDEVKKDLGMSERTVRRKCKRGELRAQKTVKGWQIDPASVEELKQKLADSSGSAAASDEQETDDADRVDADTTGTDVAACSDDGQFAEPAGVGDSATEQEVDPVAEDDGDDSGNGRVGEPEQDAVSQLAGRVEKLGARVDRISQLVADKVKKLEKENKKLTVATDNLKGGMVLMAVVFVLAAVALAAGIFYHKSQYIHVASWKHDPQQAQELAEKEAVQKRMDELKTALEKRKAIIVPSTNKTRDNPSLGRADRWVPIQDDDPAVSVPEPVPSKAEPEDKKVARPLPRVLRDIWK